MYDVGHIYYYYYSDWTRIENRIYYNILLLVKKQTQIQ